MLFGSNTLFTLSNLGVTQNSLMSLGGVRKKMYQIK